MKALIFNIQRFSIHDGPGIRNTVFFKGCPLSCKWCHNPESINREIDYLYNKGNCHGCQDCVKACQYGALTFDEDGLKWDRDKCVFCQECMISCVNSAIQFAGKYYDISGLIKEIEKERIIFEESGGGVTLSGGEPMLQIDFIEKLVKELKDRNIHITVDTCGAVPFSYFERISKYVDLFLYDFKIFDDDTHSKYIGMSNEIIIDNLLKLDKIHKNIVCRIPVIKGIKEKINAFDENMINTCQVLKNTDIKKVNLLPYHNTAVHKYYKLNMEYYQDMSRPSDEEMEGFRKIFEDYGFQAKIGG
jgi:pyruvate formate lyase activating enzyme